MTTPRSTGFHPTATGRGSLPDRPARRRRSSVRRAISLAVAAILALPLAAPAVVEAAPGVVPANDSFAAATAITSLPTEIAEVDTRFAAAGLETNEPTGGCGGGGIASTVWYRVTLPADSSVSVYVEPAADSTIDAVIAVWQGSSLGSLSYVTCVDYSSSGWEQISFAAAAGTTYYVQVGGYPGASSGLLNRILFDVSVPGNDLFDYATQGPLPIDEVVDTTWADIPREPDEIGLGGCDPYPRSTVWYRLTVPIMTTIRASATPDGVDAFVAVWAGTSLGTLSSVTCVDDVSGTTGTEGAEQVDFEASPGTTYYLQIGGTDGASRGTLGVMIRDLNAPQISVGPRVSLPIGTIFPATGTYVKTRIDWRASAYQGASIVSYTAQRNIDGGTFTSVALATPLTTTITPTLVTNRSYVYRVYATDSLGRQSTYWTEASIRPRVYQEGSTAIRYSGTWTYSSSTSYHGGRIRYARGAGASASLTFSGRGFAWISRAAPNRGKARVYVNGTLFKTVDLYRSSSSVRRVVWSATWTSTATRTVKIVVVGTPGRPQVDLDSFVILR